MDAEMVNGFIDSAYSVLKAEIGSPIEIGPPAVQTNVSTSQQVTTLIGITGSIQGVLIFGMSEQTARLIVSRMMGQEVMELDEMVQSGIAEMGNVIAGTAATEASSRGHSCTISPPTLIIGTGTKVSTVSIPRLVVPLQTSCGLIEMQLAVKANGTQRPPAGAGKLLMRAGT